MVLQKPGKRQIQAVYQNEEKENDLSDNPIAAKKIKEVPVFAELFMNQLNCFSQQNTVMNNQTKIMEKFLKLKNGGEQVKLM